SEQQKTKYESEIANLKDRIQSLENNKPTLEIRWSPEKPCLVGEAETFHLRLEIENTSNVPAINVEVQLISISPPPPNEGGRDWIGSFPIALPPIRRQQDTINPKSKTHYNL